MSDQGLVRALFSYQGSESIEPLDQYIALKLQGAYKIVSIFNVASNSHLSSRVARDLLLHWPFTPVESIDSPRR